jgi:hypothetical protein
MYKAQEASGRKSTSKKNGRKGVTKGKKKNGMREVE